MITWVTFWPMLALPAFLMSIIAAIPTVRINDKLLGGGPVREYYINHIALPIMPDGIATRLVDWFAMASPLQEWFFSLAIAINVNALLLPILYGLGCVVIAFSGWMARLRISQRRNSVR